MLVPVSIRLKSTLKSERARKILRTAEKQLLQTRLKSISSLLDNNAKQLELTRSKIASILTPPYYQQCQEFIEKIKEKRFIKVRERQVRKLNNLINKKEGGITWQSSQVSLAARAFPQVNNRQTGNSIQAGRLTLNASPQPSPGERALPQSHFSQAGSSQASPGDSTLSLAERQFSQAGNSEAFPVDSTLSLAESDFSHAGRSQAGSSQASPEDSTLSLAESVLSQAGSSQAGSFQAGSSQASPEDSTLAPAESVLSQAGRSQAASSLASPADSTLASAESALSQAGSSQASPEENTLSPAENELSQGKFPLFPRGQYSPGREAYTSSGSQALSKA